LAVVYGKAKLLNLSDGFLTGALLPFLAQGVLSIATSGTRRLSLYGYVVPCNWPLLFVKVKGISRRLEFKLSIGFVHPGGLMLGWFRGQMVEPGFRRLGCAN
jgi:hypothetical protein